MSTMTVPLRRRLRRASPILSWVAFIVMTPVILWVSVHYSRDYSTYLDVIATRESVDPFFDAYVAIGIFLGADPEYVYLLFSTTFIGLLIFFFRRRKVSNYWILIYVLCFGLLHVVTQIRAGMASVVLALFLTSNRYWIRFLTPMSVGVHTSAVLFLGAGFERRRPWLIVLAMIGAIAAAFMFGPVSEKLILYAVDFNEAQTVSIALVIYTVALGAMVVSRMERTDKAMLLTVGLLTIAVYFAFLDIKAVSNRFVELSLAVSLLIFGALDQPRPDRKPVFSIRLKAVILGSALLFFYVSNVKNSVLNI